MSGQTDRTERIREMEDALNECLEAFDGMARQMDRMEALRERMIRLFRYYGSAEWFDDREAELPTDLRAGILSEDAGYDLLTAARDTAFRMLEQGTDILKNRI